MGKDLLGKEPVSPGCGSVNEGFVLWGAGHCVHKSPQCPSRLSRGGHGGSVLALLVLVALASRSHGSMLVATGLCLSAVWVWCCLHVMLTLCLSPSVSRDLGHTVGTARTLAWLPAPPE